MAYDYKQRKKEIYKILHSKIDVLEKGNISDIEHETGGELTYSNGIKGYVTSIFVDIVNSTGLFKEKKDKTVAKIIRIFASEVIQILNDTQLFKTIGVRGDCVFAVYATPTKNDINEVFNMSVEINTLRKMINKILNENDFPIINYGIGVGGSKDLVIKVGRKAIVNDLVFVGDAVINASNLANIASRNGIGPIAIDTFVYGNICKQETEGNQNFPKWFQKSKNQDLEYYHGDIIITKFNNWIEEECWWIKINSKN